MMPAAARLRRLYATAAIAGLLCHQLLPGTAAAQPAPAAAAPPAAPYQTDPPARVGRIASQSGAVSFRTSIDTRWSAATLNFPVVTGDAFRTEPEARASLEISASLVALAGRTEFDLSILDDSGVQAVIPQGEAYLHLRDLEPDEAWLLQTPRGTVRLTAAGRYDIVAGNTEEPTRVTVLNGVAEIEGPGVSLRVTDNQTAAITGSDQFHVAMSPAVEDEFLSSQRAAEIRPPAAASPLPAQYSYMTGFEDLSDSGEWAEAPDYGQVWYPSVAQGWAPYRDGVWSYVPPWGWTWVDASHWGFAPFHFGRWAQVGGGWAWVPGIAPALGRPAYAPALVAFISGPPGPANAGSVAWVPLGPGEAYHPWYRASESYLRRVDPGQDGYPGAPEPPINSLVNRSAATAIPAAVMIGSQPVRIAARPLAGPELEQARPVAGLPILPSAATLGVTEAIARQLNLPSRGRSTTSPDVRLPPPGGPVGVAGRPNRDAPARDVPTVVQPGAATEDPILSGRDTVPPRRTDAPVVYQRDTDRPELPPEERPRREPRAGERYPPLLSFPPVERPREIREPARPPEPPRPGGFSQHVAPEPVRPQPPAIVHPVPERHRDNPERRPGDR